MQPGRTFPNQPPDARPMQVQGLNMENLKRLCLPEYSEDFPKEAALRALSRPSFLRTLLTTLDEDTLRRLKELLLQLPAVPHYALPSVRGFNNNVRCMAQLLPAPEESGRTPRPTPRPTPRLPTSTPGSFQWKVATCRFLGGFHHFMLSVGRIFGDWAQTPGHSGRHSRTAPPRRGSRRGSR
ncbi:oncostatin-M isoform X2 [Erinaceus europaeus]|uniref:Oncostatin-M isoform X2 n=1 Tax=Erinaceus europaeus TaxID=9365 RepID=A0ABM3XJ30_ERIEU|nr:oncostatin-M isoform X2 [Erinaceus europaeus]